jgi:hypothetical protein
MEPRAIVPEWGIRRGTNGSGVAIPAYTIVVLTAAETIAAASVATQNLVGVTMHAIAAGATGDIQVAGKAKVIAGAALTTPGTKLTTDATGRAVAATIAAGTVVGVIGTQSSVTTAADQTVEVELAQHGGVAIGGSGGAVHIKAPIAYTTANNAVLYTLPARMKINQLFWEVTTTFAGGTNSAIGVSSDTAPDETAGDLLGGGSGDVAATLVSTGAVGKGGTIGASFGSNGVVVLPAGAVIRFNRITSIFTSGAGFVHILGEFID